MEILNKMETDFDLNVEGDIELYTVEVDNAAEIDVDEDDEAANADVGAYEEALQYEEEGEEEDLPAQAAQHQQLPPPRKYRPREEREPGERTYQHKFTAREKWILVELVDHCKSILLSKSAKGEVRKRKLQLWNEIADEINAQCGRNRLPEHLKKLWEYMASRARKAWFEKGRRQPGEPPIHLSPLVEKIITIVHGFNVNVVMDEEQEEFRAVEVEQVPDGDVKIDWYKVYNKGRSDQEQPRSVVEDMRRLLMTTRAIKPRRQPANQNQPYQDFQRAYDEMMEPEQEVTYEDVLEAQSERTSAQRRMMEARELMYAVKIEAMAAKKMKMEAENYNLTLETLKLKHLLGELNLEFGDITGAQRSAAFGGIIKSEVVEPDDDDGEEEM